VPLIKEADRTLWHSHFIVFLWLKVIRTDLFELDGHSITVDLHVIFQRCKG